jgi:histidinol-phosphate aminotransferase
MLPVVDHGSSSVAREQRHLVRLDGAEQPFGPCPAALEAMNVAECQGWPETERDLCRRLGLAFHVSSDAVALWPGIEPLLQRILTAQRRPIVVFPPSTHLLSDGETADVEFVSVTRAAGRRSVIDAEAAADLSPDSVAYIDSPSDPLGSIVPAVDVVRLARACRYVVVDERYAEYAGMTLLPLVREFDNLVILRTFETWAGLAQAPCAWVVGAARTRHAIGLCGERPGDDAIAAACATLDNLPVVEATLRLMRDERSRVYRLLRKFSFLEPLPSWAPFVASRVQLFERNEVWSRLAELGVLLHAPQELGLEQYLRIGIGPRPAMDRLRLALGEIAQELLPAARMASR